LVCTILRHAHKSKHFTEVTASAAYVLATLLEARCGFSANILHTRIPLQEHLFVKPAFAWSAEEREEGPPQWRGIELDVPVAPCVYV